MKYFGVALIVFVVAIAATSGQECASSPITAPPPIGTLLRSVINYVIRNLVSKFIPTFVQLAPSDKELSVKTIIKTLKGIPQPNAITSVTALLQLVGVDVTTIPELQTLSSPIAQVTIDVNGIINNLLKSIPKGAKTAKFSKLVTAVGYYFADFSTEVYVSTLNNLSSNTD